MFLARVTGRVVSTMKTPGLDAVTLLLVQPLNAQLEPAGRTLVAADAIGAGAGEVVYCCKGKEASFPFLPREVPTETSVVAIVDEISREGITTRC